jgi:hypothetical protein
MIETEASLIDEIVECVRRLDGIPFSGIRAELRLGARGFGFRCLDRALQKAKKRGRIVYHKGGWHYVIQVN